MAAKKTTPPVRQLTQEEIDKLQGVYQPPLSIEERDAKRITPDTSHLVSNAQYKKR